jgi:hypothetical protein
LSSGSIAHNSELGEIFIQICDETIPLPQAIEMARAKAERHPLFDVQLAQQIPTTQNPLSLLQGSKALRALEILDAISPGNRLVVALAGLMQTPSEKIRSKAALLLGRRVQSIDWAQLCSRESDPRVRANILEALWGSTSPSAIEIFRKAMADPEPRIAANAALGIYKHDQEEGGQLLSALQRHSDSRFRCSALWAIAQTGDAKFLPTLRGSLQDADPRKRSIAVRGLMSLRKAATTEVPAESMTATVA